MWKRILVIFLAGIGSISCSTSDSNSPKSAVAGSSSAQIGVETVTVNIPAGASGLGSAAFGENPFVISKSVQVTWVNNDTVEHTVTSDIGAFDSGPITPGQTFSFIFREENNFSYFCKIHPSMTGMIQVTERPE